MVRHYPAPARPCRARQWTAFRDAEGRTLSVRLLDGMTASRLARGCAALRVPRPPFTGAVPPYPPPVYRPSCFSKTTLQFTEGSGLLRTT